MARRTQRIALVIHGGAGTISRTDLKPRVEARYRAALKAALSAGFAVLEGGGTSVGAVVAAVVVLED